MKKELILSTSVGRVALRLCLTPLDLYVKRCVARSAISLRESCCSKQHSIDHSRVLKVIFPEGRYGISGKATDYIMPEAIFLPGLRIFIPERAQWNSGILQGLRGIPIFTDGSKLAEDTDAGVFCRELGPELHFRLSGDCSVFQAEIFAILARFEFGIIHDLR